MTRLALSVLVGITGAAFGQGVQDAVVGLIDVRQVDADNSDESVQLSIPAGANLFSWRKQNRGDYDLGFGTGNDLAGGVMIVSPRNLLRDNASGGDVGGNNGGDLLATVSTSRPRSNTQHFASVHGAPSGQEMNLDIASVLFPLDAGFIAGHALNSDNNGPMTSLIGSSGLVLGANLVDDPTTNGIYSLDLRSFGATGSNGVLIACGGKNEDNFALTASAGDGTYTIYCKDNGSNGQAFENDPVAFVYLPYSTPGLVAGRIAENDGGMPTTLGGTGNFTASAAGIGRVLLQIPGIDGELDGAMLVSAEGGESRNADNIVIAAWDPDLGGYVVETRDIPSMALQGMGGEPTFGFAFIPITPGPTIEPAPEADTMVVLPDTQLYSQFFPSIFSAQTQWIADEAADRDIKMVLHLGDIVDNNNDIEWTVARNALDLIHLSVPYILAQGNHDTGPGGNGANRDSLMAQYFPVSRLAQQPTFGGTRSRSRPENSFSLFEAGGRKWVAVALEWGPRDSTLAWASDVLDQHSDRLGFVITHAYMYNDDTRMDDTVRPYGGSPYTYGIADLPEGTNDGGDIWRELITQHPNVVLVMSGHIRGEGLVSEATPFGNVVHQMLADYQGLPQGGGGFLRLLELEPGSDTISVRTYSPWEDRFFTGPGSHFELELVTAPGFDGRVCPVDLASPTDPTTPDGALTGADFFRFLDLFSAGDLAVDFSSPSEPGVPDGALTGADFFRFLDLFAQGCA